MSLFAGAQGVEVHSGQFIAATTSNTYLSGPTGIDILREASAPEAAHDASTRSYPPRCFPGTRKQYIEDIVARATPSLGDTPLPIYWMKGPAGVGKSAIAQTCAERLQKKGMLGASFFFSVSGQRNSEKLFPSIAYQLSTLHPAYRDIIDQKIRHDKTLIDKALRFQFQYLIDEPLRELEKTGNGIRQGVHVFVDGLDECETTDAQCEIIRTVVAAASQGVLPLRWTFFSRPEPHIETTFSRAHISPHCYKATLPISRDTDGEIELYLRDAFDNIVPCGNLSTQNPWPSTKDMDIVVGAAAGSFIYATTVVRFIGHPDSLSPQKRLIVILNVILQHRSHANSSMDAPFAELDAFYILILQRIPAKIFPSVHLLLALLCQFGNTSAIVPANLLGMSKDEFQKVCHHVSAVICFEDPGKGIELDPSIDTGHPYTHANMDIQRETFYQARRCLGGRVSFYHKSFLDFLLDPARSSSYCVKASEALTKQLVKVHLDYGRSFCWRGPELVLAPDVPDSAVSLAYPYINELVNSALKAWVYTWVGDEDSDKFPPPRARGLDADCDFRKWLYTSTSGEPIGIYHRSIWGCLSQTKQWQGTYVNYFPHNQFPKRAISEFKLMIKWREEANIIRRYHSTLASRIKSFFYDKSREGVESALYRVGHGDKAIFWYWEINHNSEYYRSFRSIDLAEGEKRFREQDFDSWPKFDTVPEDAKDMDGDRGVAENMEDKGYDEG